MGSLCSKTPKEFSSVGSPESRAGLPTVVKVVIHSEPNSTIKHVGNCKAYFTVFNSGGNYISRHPCQSNDLNAHGFQVTFKRIGTYSYEVGWGDMGPLKNHIGETREDIHCLLQKPAYVKTMTTSKEWYTGERYVVENDLINRFGACIQHTQDCNIVFRIYFGEAFVQSVKCFGNNSGQHCFTITAADVGTYSFVVLTETEAIRCVPGATNAITFGHPPLSLGLSSLQYVGNLNLKRSIPAGSLLQFKVIFLNVYGEKCVGHTFKGRYKDTLSGEQCKLYRNESTDSFGNVFTQAGRHQVTFVINGMHISHSPISFLVQPGTARQSFIEHFNHLGPNWLVPQAKLVDEWGNAIKDHGFTIPNIGHVETKDNKGRIILVKDGWGKKIVIDHTVEESDTFGHMISFSGEWKADFLQELSCCKYKQITDDEHYHVRLEGVTKGYTIGPEHVYTKNIRRVAELDIEDDWIEEYDTHTTVSIPGEEDEATVKKVVSMYLLAMQSRYLRKKASYHNKLRSYFGKEASAAFECKNFYEAGLCSKFNKAHAALMEKSNSLACKTIFAFYNSGRPQNVIDLHELRAGTGAKETAQKKESTNAGKNKSANRIGEAVEKLKERLPSIDKTFDWLEIIVGAGHHSHDQKQMVRPAVESFLKSTGLEYHTLNKGALLVKINTYTGPEPYFANYYCKKCDYGWSSANSWRGYRQTCYKCCRTKCHQLKEKERDPCDEYEYVFKGSSHNQELCEKCIQLGYSCEELEEFSD